MHGFRIFRVRGSLTVFVHIRRVHIFVHTTSETLHDAQNSIVIDHIQWFNKSKGFSLLNFYPLWMFFIQSSGTGSPTFNFCKRCSKHVREPTDIVIIGTFFFLSSWTFSNLIFFTRIPLIESLFGNSGWNEWNCLRGGVSPVLSRASYFDRLSPALKFWGLQCLHMH